MANLPASAPPTRDDPPVSPRLELARVALSAALALPGVVAGNRGHRGVYVTQDGETVLPGVIAVAEPGGRYSVGLFLTAALVPLHPLAEQVRQAVKASASAAGMQARLGQLAVSFLDVEEPRVNPGRARLL